MKESMFCFQCQETAKETGCTISGVCGKNSTTSARMDLLIFLLQPTPYVRTGYYPIHKSMLLSSTPSFRLLPMLISTKKASPNGSIGGSIFATVWLLRHRQPASPFLRPTN